MKTANTFIACRKCDLLHQRVALPQRAAAHCRRCGTILYRARVNSLEKTLSLVIAGLILLAIANLYPIISMELEGRPQAAGLMTGVLQLMAQDLTALGLLVLVTILVAPLLELLGLLYILVPLAIDRRPWQMAWVFRWVRRLEPWCMLEVFMLGILISLTKLTDTGDIIPGAALYALFGLSFVMVAISSNLDPEAVWSRLEAP